MKLKLCQKCKEQKVITEFHKRINNRRFKDGLYSYCKICKSIEDKIYRAKHKEKLSKQKREYFQRPVIKSYRREYIKKWMINRRRRRLDIRIMESLRTRIYGALKGYHKSKSTSILLGCPISYFIKWLESKFESGMTWKNYGEWHIDHIPPCASFDLIKPDQQKICFHHTNLQPLWAKDNLSKGTKQL